MTPTQPVTSGPRVLWPRGPWGVSWRVACCAALSPSSADHRLSALPASRPPTAPHSASGLRPPRSPERCEGWRPASAEATWAALHAAARAGPECGAGASSGQDRPCLHEGGGTGGRGPGGSLRPPPGTRGSASFSEVDSKPRAPVRAGTVPPFLLNVTTVFPSQREVADSPSLAGLAEGLRGGEGRGAGGLGQGDTAPPRRVSSASGPMAGPASPGRTHVQTLPGARGRVCICPCLVSTYCAPSCLLRAELLQEWGRQRWPWPWAADCPHALRSPSSPKGGGRCSPPPTRPTQRGLHGASVGTAPVACCGLPPSQHRQHQPRPGGCVCCSPSAK